MHDLLCVLLFWRTPPAILQFSEALAQHLGDKRDLCINVVASDQGAILPKTYPVISRGIIEQLLLAEDPVHSKAKCAQPHLFLKHRLDSG
jgi:hypothetical protein